MSRRGRFKRSWVNKLKLALSPTYIYRFVGLGQVSESVSTAAGVLSTSVLGDSSNVYGAVDFAANNALGLTWATTMEDQFHRRVSVVGSAVSTIRNNSTEGATVSVYEWYVRRDMLLSQSNELFIELLSGNYEPIVTPPTSVFSTNVTSPETMYAEPWRDHSLMKTYVRRLKTRKVQLGPAESCSFHWGGTRYYGSLYDIVKKYDAGELAIGYMQGTRILMYRFHGQLTKEQATGAIKRSRTSLVVENKFVYAVKLWNLTTDTNMVYNDLNAAIVTTNTTTSMYQPVVNSQSYGQV